MSLVVVVAIAVVGLATGPSGCGGSSNSGDNKSACLSCAMSACPTQAAACEASAGCKTLRACALACRMGDSACQNSCTAAVANDSTAVVAGANYLSCATTACPSQCSGSSASGSAGTSGGGGTTGSGGQGGAGGTGGPTGNCAAAKAKLDNCGFAQPPCSDSDSFAQCANECILDPSNNCSAIGNSTGAYVDCVNTCDILDINHTTFTVAAGGYVTTGSWKGYAWTATDGVSSTTISPANFTSLAAGGKLCVSGTVAGTSDYSAVAILGISINQAMGTPAPSPSTWTPSGTGIIYSITNTGGSPLRVQVQAAGGSTDGTKRWCRNVNASVQTPFWQDFNTKCWDNTGTYYDGTTPLESVMVLVPGDLVAVPYSFCVNALSPHP